MTVDAQQAALLVRVTARVSAVIVAANLITATRRAKAEGSGLRRVDLATFSAFLASHTTHFACVLLLAFATGGENIRNAGGWILVLIAALAFYVGAGAVLRVKMRPGAWRSARERGVEIVLLVIVWLVFFQAYALRFFDSGLFAALAVLLAYSVAGLLRAALRFQATPTSS